MLIDKYTEAQIRVLTVRFKRLGRSRNEILLAVKARFKILDSIAAPIVDEVLKSTTSYGISPKDLQKAEEMFNNNDFERVLEYLKETFELSEGEALELADLLFQESNLDKDELWS